jgi:NADH dehydrogenase
MATRSIATVLGGSGFIGRYVVKRLAAAGYVVRVAVRDTEAALFLKPMGRVGQIVLLHTPVTERPAIERALDGAVMAVNLVGILAEQRPGDFQRVHTEGAGIVATAAAAAGVGRLVHISAIGAEAGAPSLYAKSKGEGERAVHAAFPQATILRPSVVFGPEDRFFNRFGMIAQISPVMPVIAGETKFQPVYVCNVADAVMAALTAVTAPAQIYELGGPRVWTFRELLAYIIKETGRKRRMIDIPPRLARMEAWLLERLPGKLLTRDQLLLLQRDNVVAGGAPGLMELGITPTPVELVVPSLLQRFRPGGGTREIFVPG